MDTEVFRTGHITEAAVIAADIVRDAALLAEKEPLLRSYLQRRIGDVESLCAIIPRLLSAELEQPDLPFRALRQLFRCTFSKEPDLEQLAALDIKAVMRRDPATNSALTVLTGHKGFRALTVHRVVHQLWNEGRKDVARQLQALAARCYSVDIHPASPFGSAVMLDHATGIVVGETARIGNDVSIMQGVTLGGTGKETGDRHPKIGPGVLIGAGAILLGNISIGANAKVGAGSVVITDVPAGTTAVGTPAKIHNHMITGRPSETMDQTGLS